LVGYVQYPELQGNGYHLVLLLANKLDLAL
jgi:hypothetical protein